MLIGLGLCISAYYIYQNKESVVINIVKAGVKIEDIYLNLKGISISYLVPDHENHTLINQYNKYYLDRYVSNLSHTNNYHKNKNDYFVILKYNIKRKDLCFVKKSFTFSEKILNNSDMNFTSPVILCSVSIYNKQHINNCIYENIEITDIFNYLVNRNSTIILSNKKKFKQFWLYYLNYFLQDRNIYISFNDIEDIEIKWNIMDSNLVEKKGSEFIVKTDEKTTTILDFNHENEESLLALDNEYDSIEDLNEIEKVSKKVVEPFLEEIIKKSIAESVNYENDDNGENVENDDNDENVENDDNGENVENDDNGENVENDDNDENIIQMNDINN